MTEVVKKPITIEEYNQSVGGIDKANQLVLYYGYAQSHEVVEAGLFPHVRPGSGKCPNIVQRHK